MRAFIQNFGYYRLTPLCLSDVSATANMLGAEKYMTYGQYSVVICVCCAVGVDKCVVVFFVCVCVCGSL